MSLGEYDKLPKREKKTWYYYHVLANRKEEFAHEQARIDAETRKPGKSSSHPPKFRE